MVLGATMFYLVEHPNEADKRGQGVREILATKSNITELLWGYHFKILMSGNYTLRAPNDNRYLGKIGKHSAADSSYPSIILRVSDDELERMWKRCADERLEEFMSVIFGAYTQNYVTYNDVHTNETGAMWTLTSALFFSATLITTIGKRLSN